ncbi:MAG: hypothetical protein K2Q15_03890, partial [Burkholderiales bacterium]|nr:hypothetical protein [Burkholderiales bacterium]
MCQRPYFTDCQQYAHTGQCASRHASSRTNTDPIAPPPVIVAPPLPTVKSISQLEAQTLVGKLLPAKISE